MQPSSNLPKVPFRQEPWDGQRKVFDALNEQPSYLNVQLPTGYGKTYTAVGCYSLKQHAGAANRLLIVFPSDAQLRQFEKDSKSDSSDLKLACVEGPHRVLDLRFYGANAIRDHRSNTAQIFAITIQALLQARGSDNVHTLMQTGRWMVVVDEYHHYGFEKAWGRTVRALPASFLLAMSATPTRPNDDSAFGDPHIRVSYRDAVREGAVKPLVGHAYHYLIDALTPDGTIRTYTTQELVDEAGTDTADALERWRIERKMRWSPKYVSPLVWTPLERLIATRMTSGHMNLQALVGAMCVSHAELVCEQVRALFPELSVDWVGTGPHGRSDAENDEVLGRFCPRKDENGRRSPTLDVLVHVGMGGEGLDTRYVAEVVHLNRANRNNSNTQENGRAARYLEGKDGVAITGNINFDATSEYAAFVGEAIMDAMDGQPPSPTSLSPDPPEPRQFEPMPEHPDIGIYDMKLEHIDSGDPGVRRMAAVLVKVNVGFTQQDLDNPASPIHEYAIREYRAMRQREAEEHDPKALILQWRSMVDHALSLVTGCVIRLMIRNGQRPERSLAGDIKKRLNTRKKGALGEITNDLEVCRHHYQWLRNIEQDLIAHGLPTWLS